MAHPQSLLPLLYKMQILRGTICNIETKSKNYQLKRKGITLLAIEYETTYRTMREMLKNVPGLKVESRKPKAYSPKGSRTDILPLGKPQLVLEDI